MIRLSLGKIKDSPDNLAPPQANVSDLEWSKLLLAIRYSNKKQKIS